MRVVVPVNQFVLSQQKPWELDALLPADYCLPETICHQISPQRHRDFCHLLSRDVYSEGDAQFLYDYLQRRSPEFSSTLQQVLPCWLADETQHYQALRRVYRAVAGVEYGEMDQTFAQRQPDLTAIAPLLVDEFTLSATLMFDEVGSMFSYRRDLNEFYAHYGRAFLRIAQRLVQDEGKHFTLFKQVMLLHHGDRLHELPQLYALIMDLEKSLGDYHHTFLLDHAQEMYRFPPHFSQIMVQFILAQLGLADAPDSQLLQALSAVPLPKPATFFA